MSNNDYKKVIFVYQNNYHWNQIKMLNISMLKYKINNCNKIIRILKCF